MPLILAPQGQKLVDLWEFQDSLAYIESSWSSRATVRSCLNTHTMRQGMVTDICLNPTLQIHVKNIENSRPAWAT